MTINHLVSSDDDSEFEGVGTKSVTVTVKDDDGGLKNARISRDHDTAVVRGGKSEGLDPEVAFTKVDVALIAPAPVKETAGTVRIGVVMTTYSPWEPEDMPGLVEADRYVFPENRTAIWGSDYRFMGLSDYDEAYAELQFEEGDFEAYVDIEGNTRYRHVLFFDVDIINDEVAESAESFVVTFEDPYAEGNIFSLGENSCTSVERVFVTIIDDDWVQMEYSLVQAGPFDEDAGTVQVEVVAVTTEAGAPVIDRAVRVQSEDGTATSGDDYESVDETLEFAADDFVEFTDGNDDTRYRQTVSFDVVLKKDELNEDTETFLLNLTKGEGDEAAVFDLSEIEVSITDNDDPSVTVSFGASSYTVAEGGTETVTVTLSADPERTVVIPLVPANQGTTTNADYSLSASSVTFDSGETSKTITVSATDDSADDDRESVKLSFGSLPAGVTRGSPAETSVNITDNDDPSVTVSFGASSYTVAEGASETVTVTLSADPERTVVIPLVPANQGTTSNGDYTLSATSVTFDSGETSKTITVSAVDDSADDDSESVKLSFGALPAGVAAGSPAETTVNITDNDDPSVTVSFGAGTYTVAEGASETVTVTLSADPERTVVIPLVPANQGTTSNGDYTLSASSVTFDSGETSKTITVSATDDSADDDRESVKLSFGSLPAGVTRGSPDETTVEITDNDDPSVTVSFDESSYTVAEGGTETVTVTLSADPERTVVIPLVPANQGTTTNADYSLSASSVTFDSGETSKTITVSATDDSADDDRESVKLSFGSLPAGVTRGSPAETSVNITDNDDPSVTVSFGASSYTVAEGASETVTVTLSADPERTVVIPLVPANQGTTSNGDYTLSATSVTFDSGETSKTITVSAVDDSADDDSESVKLSFGALPAGVAAGSPAETTVNITDNDDPSVTVSFGAGTYTVAEGASETVTVTLSADPERTVVIPLVPANQGTTSNGDYTLSATSVTFNSGETSKTITVSAVDDSADDDRESVKLSFGALPAGVTRGSPDETTVEITDNDDPSVTVSFDESSYTVAEGGTETVTVTLSADPERTVVIPLVPANQGTTTNADYTLSASSVTFDSGETSKTITVSATDDSADDDSESVKLSFGSLPAGVTRGSPAETSVNITDNDDPSVTVSFGASSYTVAEGASETVTVTLSADPERTVVIPLVPANQGTTSNGDYTLSATSVTFDSGETSKTITVSAVDDSADDDSESVKLSFGALPAGVAAGSPAETTVNITDNDDPSVTVSFGAGTYTVAEGASETVTVTLSADPERTVVIPLVPANQGTTSNGDYTLSATSVTFNSGETSKTITVSAVDDSADDDRESVKLSFGALPAGVAAGSPAETSVNITDNDDEVQPLVAMMEVSFEHSHYSVQEGHEFEVKVKLDRAPEHRMDIELQKTNKDGTSDDDYSGVPPMLTFDPGETEKTFTFFANDDEEYEDDEAVELSFKELPEMVREGDPFRTTVDLRDNSITCVDNTGARRNAPQGRAAIVTVLSGRGVISSPGEVDTWVIPGVDPFRTYLVEILGADSPLDIWGQDVGGGLTLADPHPVSLAHEDGNPAMRGFGPGLGDAGAGRNSRFVFIFSEHGDFVLKVKSADDQGTGSYHLLVRHDNYCDVRDDGSIVFPGEGGPDGYAHDIRADTGTRFDLNMRQSSLLGGRPYFAGGHMLGDNWGAVPDEDWFRFALEADTKYEVYLEGSPRFPVEHRLTRPRIVGIFDESGGLFHEGAAGNGTDTSVGLTFETTASGSYYLGVGSNPGDRTGVYTFRVEKTEPNSGQAAINNSPTGGPGIIGTPRIGEELAATTSGIDDADGLEHASFSYQWVRHDPLGNTDTDIQGATGPTYTVMQEDQGRAIKVRVEFTDDRGTLEKLTSFALFVLPPVEHRATGQPTISGTPEVGHILTADTSRISGATKRGKSTFRYQWLAGGLDIRNATGRSYTLTEDEAGLTIQVSVTFTNSGALSETRTSDPTGPVQFRPTVPVIRGAARVGEILTTDTSGLTDADGLTKASYAYQWLAGSQDIPGATGSGYTLTEDDEGLRIRVRVRFTDDAGNEETRTSQATAVVALRETASPPGRPTNLRGVANTDGTVTLRWEAPADDSVRGYQILRRRPAEGEETLLVHVDDTGSAATEYTDVDVTPGVLHAYRVKARNAAGPGQQSNFVNVTPTQPDEPSQNSPPAGVPTIRGTAQVGETLTADTSKITDADGLTTVSYEYQWLAEFSGLVTEISGATSSSYTLQAAEEGAAIRVRVRFADDRGHPGTLTSAATDTVAAALEPPAQPGNPTASVNADGTVSLSWEAPSDDTVSGYRILRRRPDQGEIEFLVLVGDTGSRATEFTDRTVEPGVRYVYSVAALNAAGAGAPSATVEATPPHVEEPVGNREATGAPVIRGSALVGETLTVDPSGITDTDGLSGAVFSYQWILTDGGSFLELPGATESTYTIVALDRYVRMLVRVSFIDDRGHKETRTSEPTDVIR